MARDDRGFAYCDACGQFATVSIVAGKRTQSMETFLPHEDDWCEKHRRPSLWRWWMVWRRYGKRHPLERARTVKTAGQAVDMGPGDEGYGS